MMKVYIFSIKLKNATLEQHIRNSIFILKITNFQFEIKTANILHYFFIKYVYMYTIYTCNFYRSVQM